jgi:integrase
MREGSIPTRSGARYKPAAIRVYEIALRRHVLPELGDVRLSDVRRADVQELADRLTAAGAAASTVQNALEPLRVIYRRAIRRDLVAVDPTRGLELRRPTGRRERIASPDEARALLEALPRRTAPSGPPRSTPVSAAASFGRCAGWMSTSSSG